MSILVYQHLFILSAHKWKVYIILHTEISNLTKDTCSWHLETVVLPCWLSTNQSLSWKHGKPMMTARTTNWTVINWYSKLIPVNNSEFQSEMNGEMCTRTKHQIRYSRDVIARSISSIILSLCGGTNTVKSNAKFSKYMAQGAIPVFWTSLIIII
jgi:hypothetical protein